MGPLIKIVLCIDDLSEPIFQNFRTQKQTYRHGRLSMLTCNTEWVSWPELRKCNQNDMLSLPDGTKQQTSILLSKLVRCIDPCFTYLALNLTVSGRKMLDIRGALERQPSYQITNFLQKCSSTAQKYINFLQVKRVVCFYEPFMSSTFSWMFIIYKLNQHKQSVGCVILPCSNRQFDYMLKLYSK